MLTLSPTLKLIINRTIPLTMGVFAIMLVQLVDTIFIGMLGIDELTVQGITLPFHTVLIGFQVGIGVAATSIIALACGAKQQDKAKATASITVALGVLFLSMICLLLWSFGDQLFHAFISEDVSPERISGLHHIFDTYWPVWLSCAIPGSTLYLVNAVYRANQDTKTPGLIYIVASTINLILDPILIFTLDMGISGAAVASGIAYGSCASYMLVKARNKNWFSALRITPAYLGYVKDLIQMTIPTTANQILPSVSAFLGMMLISGIGTDAIAYWSLQSRLETFMLVLSLALTMSIPPLVGKYRGEKNFEAIANLLSTTTKFTLGFHFVVALLIALSSGYLVPVITGEEMLRNLLGQALWIIPFSYGPLGLCMVVVSAFNALGIPKRALLISFTRLFILYIPAIWIGTQTESIINTVIAATIANFLAGLNAWFMLRKHLNLSVQHNEAPRALPEV